MENEATLEELHSAIGDTLQSRGITNEIKARLRSEIFKVLGGDEIAPKPANENLVINELIREYLSFNGYMHTLSVFLPESGQPKEISIPRGLLASEVNVQPVSAEDKDIPLLYSMVNKLQNET